MNSKKLLGSILLLFSLIFISACVTVKSSANTDMVSELSSLLIEKVLENYADGNVISEEDIAIDRIYYGSFSHENVSEILVLCKILNTSHVAGLDKTVAVLLEAESLELTAYQEFGADKVEIHCMQTSNGQSRILVSNTTVNQGISTQTVELFAIENSQWIEIPIDALKTFEELKTLKEGYFCFIGDNLIIVVSESKLTRSEEIVEVLIWNPETEKFLLEQ